MKKRAATIRKDFGPSRIAKVVQRINDGGKALLNQTALP
jgi:hypothetical protein